MRFLLACSVTIAATACSSTDQHPSRRDKDLQAAIDRLDREREQSSESAKREAERDMQRQLDDLIPKVTPGAKVIPPTKGIPKPPPPSNCIDSGTISAIQIKGSKVKACFDTNMDDEPDACATWERATAKLVSVEPVFDVEASDIPKPEPVVDPDADDPRVQQTDNVIEACPEDRICMRFMPKLADGDTIDSVRGDPKHRAVAMTITDADSANPRVETWNLGAGRMTGRWKFDKLDPDMTYDYVVKSFGDAFLAIAKHDTESMITLLGLDGNRRAALGNGAKFIDADQLVEIAPNKLAIIDIGESGKPYTVYVHDLQSGAVNGRFVIPLDGDGDDDVHLKKIDRSTLGVVQFSSHVRVDVLDLRSSSSKNYVVPGC